jgi:hypothetical protein
LEPVESHFGSQKTNNHDLRRFAVKVAAEIAKRVHLDRHAFAVL